MHEAPVRRFALRAALGCPRGRARINDFPAHFDQGLLIMRLQPTSSRKSIRAGSGTRRPKPNMRRPFLEPLERRVVLTTPGTWQSLAATNPGSGPTYGQALAVLSDGTVMVQSGNNSPSNSWYDLSPAQTGNTFPGTTTNTGNYVNGTWSSLAASGTWQTPTPEKRLFNTSALLPSGQVFAIGGEYSSPDPFTGTAEIFTPSTTGGPGSWRRSQPSQRRRRAPISYRTASPARAIRLPSPLRRTPKRRPARPRACTLANKFSYLVSMETPLPTAPGPSPM